MSKAYLVSSYASGPRSDQETRFKSTKTERAKIDIGLTYEKNSPWVGKALRSDQRGQAKCTCSSCGQSSKRWTLCNTGVLSTPKAGTAETPNAGVLYGPKAVVLETPKPGALDPKGELETSWLPAPKVDEPNALLLEAGCDCANELPKGPDVKSKLPNAGFCANMDDLPKGDDEAASNAVLEVAPGCLIAVIKWVSDHPFGISNSGLKNVMSNKPNLNVSSCTVSENRSTRVWILAYAGFFGGLRFIFLHIMMGVWITAYTSLQVLRT
ncbi:hypothetical protein Tco_0479184 [Tanacetum coccineum]